MRDIFVTYFIKFHHNCYPSIYPGIVLVKVNFLFGQICSFILQTIFEPFQYLGLIFLIDCTSRLKVIDESSWVCELKDPSWQFYVLTHPEKPIVSIGACSPVCCGGSIFSPQLWNSEKTCPDCDWTTLNTPPKFSQDFFNSKSKLLDHVIWLWLQQSHALFT